MYRIPVINQSTLFEDINRNALVQGKLEILDPVSNNPLTIWSYTDDEYTVMTNPVILDIEGRVSQTVFCDRIVYVRVYAFKGRDEHYQPISEFIISQVFSPCHISLQIFEVEIIIGRRVKQPLKLIRRFDCLTEINRVFRVIKILIQNSRIRGCLREDLGRISTRRIR